MNLTGYLLSTVSQKNSTINGNDTTMVFPINQWILSSYVFLAFAGIVGNILILSVIAKNKPIRESSIGVYLSGLAIADLFVAVTGVPVYVLSTGNFKHHPKGVGGAIMCKILTGYNITFYFAVVSVYIMLALSWDRYYAICKPTSANRNLNTPGRAKKVIAGIWVLSLIHRINPLIGVEYAEPSEADIGAHCKFSITYHHEIIPKLIYSLNFSAQYVIPVSIMIYCFTKIRKELLNQNEKLVQLANGSVENQSRMRARTVNTIVWVIIAYFVLWTPNQFLYFCFNFGLFHMDAQSLTLHATIVVYFATCCINPIIYAFRSQMFRYGFLATFKCICMKKRGKQRDFTTISDEMDNNL